MKTGDILGNYRIDRLLGEGGMGAVYQAFDLTLQRDVAIKLIHPHFARRSEFQERFMQEARIMARLDHPGIVKVFVLGKHGDQLFLPMEFIKGGNLRQLLDRLSQERKWILLSEAVLLMRQLCQTVNYAHEHGVLHRDIKPANLMLKPEPTDGLQFRIVLTDLGLAKLLQGLGMTQEGLAIGTPAYMSPEQASGRNTDARSDVYSLGILLYELAVGRLPFPIRSITEAVRYHTQERPPAPRSIRPELPESLERAILKALEKEPDKRYQSAAELGAVLGGSLGAATEIVGQAAQNAVSLITQYEDSLMTPVRSVSASLMTMFDGGSLPARGESVFQEKSLPPSSQTRIQVVYRDKTAQVFPFRSGTVTIGRGPNNDIPVSDQKVSSRHAQVTWDGMEYHVMDLNSRNGTYLGNTRLLPGMSEVWRPNQNLRIGDTWLRLIRPAENASQISGIRSGTSGMRSNTGNSLYRSSGPGVVGVSVTPPQLSVVPGESVICNLTLLNQSPNVDHFSLSIADIPSSWIASLPSSVQLMPGEQTEVPFSLLIPRSHQSRAGRRPLTLRVASQRDTGQFVEVKLPLTITAYSQFKAELQPQRLRAGQAGQLTISNQGNAPETFRVKFTDPAGELTFEPSQPQAQVGPGETTLIQFHPKLNQPRLIGSEKKHSFSAQVSVPDGESQTLHADMVSQALVPVWAPAITFLLCLALVGAAIWIIAQSQANQVPTDPVIPGTGTNNPINVNPGAPSTFTPWPQSITPTSTSSPPAQTTKTITAFGFTSPTANGVINEPAHTIAVTVPFGTNVTALAPTITHTGASISPSNGAPQNFTSPVTYTVTAADGSTQTYTVTVTRAASNNANLSSLGFSVTGTLTPPVFAPDTTSYTLAVANNITSLTVIPAAGDATAIIRVNGNPVASGSASGSINLNVGDTPITIAVTAQDGITTRTYTVTARRTGSNNANLNNLQFNPTGTLNPTFSPGTATYTLAVANNITSLTVIPTAADPTASIRVNNVPVASGSASGSIALSIGDTSISIIVTAQDGTTARTYTVTVTRAGSTNANLSNLVFSTGALTPVFTPGTTIYTQSVPNDVTSLTVTPIAADPTATIRVNGNPVASGSASSSIPLNIGDNTITVTAQDGTTTKNYSVTVTRAGSTNANLSNLVFSTGPLNPAFASDTIQYTQTVSNFTPNLIVTPIAADPTATITVNGTTVPSGSTSGSIPLNFGTNTISIIVTAQDGTTTKNYRVTVIRF